MRSMRPGFQTSLLFSWRIAPKGTEILLPRLRDQNDNSTMSSLARKLTAGAPLIAGLLFSILPQIHADIPWPEVMQRLAYENEKLAQRPQGHNGEYFVV